MTTYEQLRATGSATAVSTREPVLQRKCACGARASGLTGECADCAKKTVQHIQPRLAIGEAGDPFEREADRITEQVSSASGHADTRATPPHIRSLSGPATAGGATAPTSVDRALADAGCPLAPEVRQDMEQRFGYDFSRVRVHTGSLAERSAQD